MVKRKTEIRVAEICIPVNSMERSEPSYHVRCFDLDGHRINLIEMVPIAALKAVK